MRFVLIGATAAMALLGAAVLATAHAQDEKGKGGGGPAAEGRGGQQQGQRGGESERPKQQPGAGQRDMGQRDSGPKAAQPRQQRDNDRPKATQQQDKERPKSTQQQDKERPKATEQQSKDRPKSTQQQDKDLIKASEQQDKDRSKSTERQRDKDRSKSMGQQQDRDKDGQRSAQPRGEDKSKAAEGSDKRRVHVSDENRRGAGKRIREAKVERVNRSRITVNVRIGATIPRTIRLYTLPVVVYDEAPAYRGYSYVLLDDDTILIVDARTYEIIDVIPSGSLRADGPRRHLALSDDQMRFVFSSVSRDRRSDVRVRLALGAEVPRGIELIAFPAVVTARIGELEDYRYIVTDDGVVVVDPSDHAVVLVISN